MTPGQRSSYFLLWTGVCAEQGWSAKDKAKRNATTARCMSEIGAPATDSTTDLGEDEITALFCYLHHLADQASLDKSARWDSCRQDYKTFSRARHADWHETQLYGEGKNKLDRNRFKGEASASRGALEDLDPEAVRQRHMTVASRHQKKARKLGQPRPSAVSTSATPAAHAKAPAIAPAARTTPPSIPADEFTVASGVDF